MKISVDDVELYTLTDVQKDVIKNDVHADHFEDDMRRRLEYILMRKYELCFKRLKEEWDIKLAQNGVEMVPTDPDSYAQLVFAQPNYMDRKERDEASQGE